MIEGLKLEMSVWNSFGWLIYAINSVDNTKLPCYTLSPTQHHSFFRNLPLCSQVHVNLQKWKYTSIFVPKDLCGTFWLLALCPFWSLIGQKPFPHIFNPSNARSKPVVPWLSIFSSASN